MYSIYDSVPTPSQTMLNKLLSESRIVWKIVDWLANGTVGVWSFHFVKDRDRWLA